MTYVLIFWALWSVPYSHWEAITVEPLYSVAECDERAEALWKIVQADGAISWEATCSPAQEMEV